MLNGFKLFKYNIIYTLYYIKYKTFKLNSKLISKINLIISLCNYKYRFNIMPITIII